jgi:hypothetical protein
MIAIIMTEIQTLFVSAATAFSVISSYKSSMSRSCSAGGTGTGSVLMPLARSYGRTAMANMKKR